MSKTFVIADLHGRYDLLQLALQRIEQGTQSGGKVVFLGDYIDRGSQSKQIIERLIAGPPDGWEWVTLKGNHEAMMVQCIAGQAEISWWTGNGGDETLRSYGGTVPSEHFRWADKLPLIHHDAHRVYVHAGVEPTVKLDEQREKSLLWMRYPTKADVTFPGKHIVHGHTPHRNGPEFYPGRTNLDTGAVFFGRLVVGVFDDDKPGGPISLIEVTGH
jgi:serine/threonine protein phosphatase 1